MTSLTPALLPIGETFHDRYQVVRRLGKGGMGEVYEVRDLTVRKPRALKVMRPDLVADPDLRGRFEQEARITGDIDSEHLVEITDAGTDAQTGFPFIAMELLKGDDLAAVSQRRGGLPASEVVALLDQAADALDKTHQAGIVHRDLKPANLFLTKRSDGSPRLKVLDFGIAKLMATSLASAKTTCVIGTPLYMAPEQFRGDGMVDARADTYALGHIAFALLVGLPYWTPESSSANRIMKAVEQGQPEPACARAMSLGKVHLPPAFDAWFARATGAAPETRFETASALVDELAAVFGLRETRGRQGHLSAGHVFRGRYRVVKHIGDGGMGEVYEVVDQVTGRRRALKLLKAKALHDDDLRRRFLLEARVTAGIGSRHLVEVLDAAEAADAAEPFLVMELLHGETLEAILSRDGPLSPAEVVGLLVQAAEALDRTHAANVIHRDLKPDNLFLARADDGSQVLKVIDFGLAKVIVSEQTEVTRALGTPVFMAPEQFGGAGKIDRRADLYSLGHIAFALLTGAPYWSLDPVAKANVYQLMYQINRGVTERATIRAAQARNVLLPPAFDEWFSRAVAVDPSHRFSSASELVATLGGVLGLAGDRTSSPRAGEPGPANGSPPPTVGHASTLPAIQAAASPAAGDSLTAPLSSSELITLRQPARAPAALPDTGVLAAVPVADPHSAPTTLRARAPQQDAIAGYSRASKSAPRTGRTQRHLLFAALVCVAVGLGGAAWRWGSASSSPVPDTAAQHVAAEPVSAASASVDLPSPSSTPPASTAPSASSAQIPVEPPTASSIAPRLPPLTATTATGRPGKPPALPPANTGPTGTKVR